MPARPLAGRHRAAPAPAAPRRVRHRRCDGRARVLRQPAPPRAVPLGRLPPVRGRRLRQHRQPGTDQQLLLAEVGGPATPPCAATTAPRPTLAAPTTTAGTPPRTRSPSPTGRTAGSGASPGGSTSRSPTAGTATATPTPRAMQGAFDHLRGNGVEVGICSTGHQWNTITGGCTAKIAARRRGVGRPIFRPPEV